MQPFKLRTFQQGVAPDADILLKHLHGESITEDILQQEERVATAQDAKQQDITLQGRPA